MALPQLLGGLELSCTNPVLDGRAGSWPGSWCAPGMLRDPTPARPELCLSLPMLLVLQLFVVSVAVNHGSGRGCHGDFLFSCPDPLRASLSHLALTSRLMAACGVQSPPATPLPGQPLLKELDTRLGLQPDPSPCQGSVTLIQQQRSL